MHSGVGRISDGSRNARKNNTPNITYRTLLPEENTSKAAIARIDAPALHPLRGEGFADVAARAAASYEGVHLHASHGRLPVRGGGPGTDGEDGACVIEPAVRCTHCGYCQSYGH